VSSTKTNSRGRSDGLRLIEQFLNTRDLRMFGIHAERSDQRDELMTVRELRVWLRERRLIGDSDRVSRADLERAVALREALRTMLDPNETRRRRDDGRRRLRRLAAELPVYIDFDGSARPLLTSRSRGVDGALTRLLISAVEASIADRWSRLKLCAAADCHWGFVDDSRNRLQRWCATRVCGNRMKTRNYRKRQRSREPGRR
jgi:predicted RNA-binding Zn ribbon-like protein